MDPIFYITPVMYTDSTGQFAVGIFLAITSLLLFTPVGGAVAQVAIYVVSYAGMAIASILDSDIRADMNAIGWNPFNSNEAAVLGSNKVSFYKGAPVFLKNSGRSGSFYAISLNRNNSTDDLRHEWGHNVQAMIMGPVLFGAMIGLPSWQEWGQHKWGNRDYYRRPWEASADMFGGVVPRSGYFNPRTEADERVAWWYLAVSTLFGPFGYFFLI